MIPLKLHRDEAREITAYFFIMLGEVCRERKRSAIEPEARMMARLVLCVFNDIQKKFAKKLLTDQNSFTVQLTEAEGIVLYQLLMTFPVDPMMVYQIVMRQKITDYLHDLVTV